MKKNFKSKIIILVIIIFIIIGFFSFHWLKPQNQKQIAYSPTTYYSIFLDNGQVYFGNIKEIEAQTLTINNVYYLQANQNLQDTQSKDKKQEVNTNLDLALVKLGKEIHGPKDEMSINREHVLFWEELRTDSKVVQAIKTYKQ